ncbi:P-loop ATPase, Sll1717 family [Metapseudomonas furukawaii]|uniref:Uncharacterized protein n=1 Tax=Metapseudomonas furukawaii TaxID=1149133 RepID=A0AAD1BZU6_METFU|nr:hypothetical protein [Pseudomonas furukawaii]ELS27864.1 hypothetical protein ppKF707_2124 [Pseudomonas furukawaii]BAU74162.1 hypothetical protein KF707C_24740 [Pseudomonas furukawaii]
MSLIYKLGLSGNPFENYTAETEPDIGEYAVRPPYLESISARARKLSSFILFGDRGAGKSATRLTVFKEIWGSKDSDKPFIVNLTDFSSIIEIFKKDKLSEKEIIFLAAYNTIEQMLAWLASLNESDRSAKLSSLTKEQRSLIMALVQGFYLSKEEMDREHSTAETFRLLDSTWQTKAVVWTTQRGETISKIIAEAVALFSRRVTEDDSLEISEPAEKLLKSLIGDSPNAPRAILHKLVELAQIFGFTGVCMLVDKLDETAATMKSAESTAKLIHPLLSHIQLLEVVGFSWIFFIWRNVTTHFNGKHEVRLDKIPSSNIVWGQIQLREMLDKRVEFFSSGALNFSQLFEPETDMEQVYNLLLTHSINSPRELIKIIDIIIREHDINEPDTSLTLNSVNAGINKYCIETIDTWHAPKILQQIYRLGKTPFINQDVQTTFKIGDQGARVKIKTWEDAGLVKQSGTLPSSAGGKQVYRYVISDPRVIRIIENTLDPSVGIEFDEFAEEPSDD